jgi:hypothetical protein
VGEAVGVGSRVGVTGGVEVGKAVSEGCGVCEVADSEVGCLVSNNPDVSRGISGLTRVGLKLPQPAANTGSKRQMDQIDVKRRWAISDTVVDHRHYRSITDISTLNL